MIKRRKLTNVIKPYTLSPPDEISALVFEFGSYTSKIGHSGEDCPRVTFPTWIGKQDKLNSQFKIAEEPVKENGSSSENQNGSSLRKKHKFPYKIGELEISYWQENLELKNPMKECLG